MLLFFHHSTSLPDASPHLVGRHGSVLLVLLFSLVLCAVGASSYRFRQDDTDQVSGDDAAGRQSLTGV